MYNVMKEYKVHEYVTPEKVFRSQALAYFSARTRLFDVKTSNADSILVNCPEWDG